MDAIKERLIKAASCLGAFGSWIGANSSWNGAVLGGAILIGGVLAVAYVRKKREDGATSCRAVLVPRSEADDLAASKECGEQSSAGRLDPSWI